MKFIKIRDLEYVTADNSMINLLATCEEYGEIPMTLNLIDTEDIHTFLKADGSVVSLEQYCKTQHIAPYVEPAPLPEPIPQVITMRQCRLYLLNQNLLDNVENIVSQNKAWQIEWEYATDVLKDSPLVSVLANELDLNQEQLNMMFIEASKL